MKDVTFGAAREIAGGKAGMDDNSESGMLRVSHSLRSSAFKYRNK